MIVVVALLTGAAAYLALSPPPRARRAAGVQARAATTPAWRPVACAFAGVGVWLVLGGAWGLVAGAGAGASAWWVLQRSEPAGERREREQAAGELPQFVDLVACALRAGAAPAQALGAVAHASPGPGATRVLRVLDQLRWGLDPAQAWSLLADDDVLAPLGRALVRVEDTGGSVVEAVEALADELESAGLAAVEDRARTVGVKAALPLGLCLLPAFMLLGIVPIVAALLAELTL